MPKAARIIVREIREDEERLCVCEVCGFAYKERTWAEKCQGFCTRHNACSLEITSRALKRVEDSPSLP